MNFKRMMQSAAVLAIAASLSSQAQADVAWSLANVTFNDGGTIESGTFTVDTYEYLLNGATDVETTAGSSLGGFTYTYGNINNEGGTGLPDNVVTFYFTGAVDATLVLQFQNALTTPQPSDPIVPGGSSYEISGGVTRDVTGGYAVAPEAPTWAMMILGAGLLAGGRTFLRGRARLRPA